MATGYVESNSIHIDFVDDTWLNKVPAVYNFVNTDAIPWQVDSTFQYESQPTLRSGAISHGGTTTLTLNFELVEDGSITFPYCISSESNCDWLTVNIDGTQRVRVSGTYSWTVYTQQLDAGAHTVTFTYSKDGSVSRDLDATAIGYIDIVGVIPNYSMYYLVHDLSTNKYYANVDGSLTEASITEAPTRQDFIDYGGAIPTVDMLESFTRFELLKCADTSDGTAKVSGMTYSVVGNPKPELFKCTNPVSITEQYQTGFKSVSFAISKLETTTVKVLLSYDDTTWFRYNPATDVTETAQWMNVTFDTDSALANGMTLAELEDVDADAFALLYTEGVPKTLYIAFVIQSTELDNWVISSLRVEFVSDK